MIHEVRVFDGKGKLKEIIQPEFDYDPTVMKKFPSHPCKFVGCTKKTNRKNYCSNDCSDKEKYRKAKIKIAERKRLNGLKPKVLCEICKKEVKGKRLKYCSPPCDLIARKVKDTKKNNRISLLIKLKKEELKNAEHTDRPRC